MLSNPQSARILSGIRAIAPEIDGFILDVWGVLHDGVAAYPGVSDCLVALKSAGKRVVILSNAPMRAASVTARLATMGIGRDFYHDILTSGEEVWRSLAVRSDPFYRQIGIRCYFLGPERHRMLEGLDLVRVVDVGDADFFLNTGPDDLALDGTPYRDLLKAGAERGLPMICANADLTVMHGDALIACAGTLAQQYETMGGTVRWHGKPMPSVYATCRRLLGLGDDARILAVGDSLRTDIAGGKAAALSTLLVAGGMLAQDLGAEDPYIPLDPDRIAPVLLGQPTPDFIISRFTW